MLGLMHSQPKDMARSMNYYANLGNATESSVVNEYILNNSILAYDFKIPKEFFDEFDVGGKIDIVYQINGTPILSDIKSTSQVSNLSEIAVTKDDIQTLLLEFEKELALNSNLEYSEFLNRITESKKTFNPKNHAYIAQVQVYSAITGIDHCYLQYFSRRVQDTFTLDGVPSHYVYEVDTSEEILKRRVANIYYSILCRDNLVIPKK